MFIECPLVYSYIDFKGTLTYVGIFYAKQKRNCFYCSVMFTLEERNAIKLCYKHGKNATEIYGMLQTAFRPSCMNRALVFEWHKRFKEGGGFCEGWWEVWEE